MPEHFLVVQHNEDALYCFDTRHVNEKGEMPVICYELYNGSDGRIAKDFTEFFTDWFLKGYAERDA